MNRDALSRWVGAGLLTGISDGLFSSVLAVAFYHSTVARLWQGVASTLLGPEALTGGSSAVLVIPFVGLPIVASMGRPGAAR